MARFAVCWVAGLLALLLACGSEPRPASIPASEVEAAPDYPATSPLGDVELPENCDIFIEGEREVERALLDLREGTVMVVQVTDGRRLEIVCPGNPADRKNVMLLAELASDSSIHTLENVVRWELDLDPDPDEETVRLADAKPGLPQALNDQDLAQIKQQWPEMIEWQRAAESDTTQPRKSGPAPVSVQFLSGRLKWAEIVYTHQASKRKKRAILNPRGDRSLAPGVYLLQVRFPESSTEWQDAGSFEVPVGAKQVQIKLVESPRLQAEVERVE